MHISFSYTEHVCGELYVKGHISRLINNLCVVIGQFGMHLFSWGHFGRGLSWTSYAFSGMNVKRGDLFRTGSFRGLKATLFAVGLRADPSSPADFKSPKEKAKYN